MSLNQLIRAAAVLAWIPGAAFAGSEVPAFPGVEGAGAGATGGRGGKVVHVTNLNASGPGSLQEAVSGGDCIVVFDVSGIIDLNPAKDGSGKSKKSKPGKISVTKPNVTIAGQTAPGEGICIKGGALQIAADNVIVRYLRSRRGWNAEGDSGDAIEAKGNTVGELAAGGGQSQQAFDKRKIKKESRGKFIHEFAGMSNVVIDHCSTSWATDENLTCTHVDRATVSWSIAAEGCDYPNPKQTPPNHSEGSLWGSGTPDGRSTMHHMLYAHNRLRNPRTTGGTDLPPILTFYNNVVYDWSEHPSHTGSERVHLNWLNNYYKPGPDTPDGIRGVGFEFHGDPLVRVYATGNIIEGSAAATRDNKLAVSWDEHKFKKVGAAERTEMLADRMFGELPGNQQTAPAAYQSVLAEAGATLPARDAVDLRIVNQVRTGTGKVIDKETDLPADRRWPDYRSLPPLPDADGDGMPDSWEKQFGLNPRDAADAPKISQSYSNIEHYFNNSDPTGGGAQIVFISAMISRANVPDGGAGEWRVWRTGSLSSDLTVKYAVTGDAEIGTDCEPLSGRVTIPAGQAAAAIRFKAGNEARDNRMAVASLVDDAANYRIGCPSRSLIVIRR